MAKDLEVKVEGRPSVVVEVVPEDFSLAQFDAWVRSRFGLKHDTPLAYLNDAGKGKSHCNRVPMLLLLLGNGEELVLFLIPCLLPLTAAAVLVAN